MIGVVSSRCECFLLFLWKFSRSKMHAEGIEHVPFMAIPGWEGKVQMASPWIQKCTFVCNETPQTSSSHLYRLWSCVCSGCCWRPGNGSVWYRVSSLVCPEAAWLPPLTPYPTKHKTGHNTLIYCSALTSLNSRMLEVQQQAEGSGCVCWSYILPLWSSSWGGGCLLAGRPGGTCWFGWHWSLMWMSLSLPFSGSGWTSAVGSAWLHLGLSSLW